jgi:serine/threonine protein kinase
MLKSGEMLNGRYRVVRLVGKGGFGAVYEAHDVRFQSRRTIAVKEMSNTKLSPAERVQAIKDFRREADLLVQLNHPHLPHVSDFFEESDKAYLVMEFVHGDTLEKVQQDAGGPLDEKRVMEWALQLCDVLNYLHTRPQPIIFRDLKPTNVMVTQDGQIKLIDFGIARIFKSTARQDTNYMGSLGYAPLEQYGSGQTDARSDIYALGATLYDLLTHTTPIDAPARVLHPQNFKTPRQINPGVSNRVERIVLKAMEKDPEDRFQTAAEMYQAIDAYKVGAGVVRSGTVTAAAANPQQWAKSFTVLPPKGSKGWIAFVSIPIIVMILLATLLLRFLLPGQVESPDDIGLNSIGPGGIGMYTINGEDVGISDGKYAFDTNRDGKGKDYKIQACAS